uniref:Transmembrane protein n=1 Tax=Cacopsylla melanoneura TaxID=428564 RepID=A0A8D8M9W8_9HEMI
MLNRWVGGLTKPANQVICNGSKKKKPTPVQKKKKIPCFFYSRFHQNLNFQNFGLRRLLWFNIYYLLSVNGTLPAINVPIYKKKGVLFVLLYTKIYLRLPNILLLSINFYILFVKNKHVFILD